MKTLEARQGDRITFIVTSARAGQFYVHGPEVESTLLPGVETSLTFTAQYSGRYYVHFHQINCIESDESHLELARSRCHALLSWPKFTGPLIPARLEGGIHDRRRRSMLRFSLEKQRRGMSLFAEQGLVSQKGAPFAPSSRRAHPEALRRGGSETLERGKFARAARGHRPRHSLPRPYKHIR